MLALFRHYWVVTQHDTQHSCLSLCLGVCTWAPGTDSAMAEASRVCWFIPRANRVALSEVRGGTDTPTYFGVCAELD